MYQMWYSLQGGNEEGKKKLKSEESGDEKEDQEDWEEGEKERKFDGLFFSMKLHKCCMSYKCQKWHFSPALMILISIVISDLKIWWQTYALSSC